MKNIIGKEPLSKIESHVLVQSEIFGFYREIILNFLNDSDEILEKMLISDEWEEKDAQLPS